MYIVLEGMDLAGKSTLTKQLTERLKADNYDVLQVEEPAKSPDSLLTIRNLIIDNGICEEAKLYLAIAQRIELGDKVVVPALNQGKTVISDRCFISTAVYQGNGRIGLYSVIERNVKALKIFSTQMYPDKLIFVKIDHDTFLQRAGSRSILDDQETRLLNREYFERFVHRYENALSAACSLIKIKPYFYDGDFEALVDYIKN
ncbi:putative thymidine kinase [Klebsiella phage KPN8]|nr:putative thymidine kinase [Klebsiella phage KPN8]